MTIKGTGSLSFEDDIEKEFGENPSRSLGSYRRDHPDFSNKNCGSLTNLPLDDGIPVSGEIKFSDFYGKKLNIVVDYYSVAENREDTGDAKMAATYRYLNQNAKVKIVGGYQSKPAGSLTPNTYNLTSADWNNGKKVFINVNKQIGGKKSSNGASISRNFVALRTGGWPSGTSLQIDIGPSGRLQGAGGDGRQGTTSSGTPTIANAGTSALGVETPAQINVALGGIIRCGYGGGGGGGGANSNPNKSTTDYGRSGGGGGGGAGIPAGDGGAANCGGYTGKTKPPNVPCGGAGGNGSSDAGGTAGAGADHGAGSGGAGNGGIGGDIVDPAAAGTAGSGSRMSGSSGAGPAGPRGYGIIYGSAGVQNASSGNTTVSANEGGVIVGGIY